MRFWVLVSLVLSPWSTVCEETTYTREGSEAVLSPSPTTGPVESIFWKKGNDVAIEYYKDSDTPLAYREFKDRGSLNTDNGTLTIKGVTRTDSGLYTVEINKQVNKKITLEVIASVVKPNITKSCHDDYCDLTCEGKTVEAEPVSYVWILDKKSIETETKEYNLTKGENVKLILCELRNPVSSEQSDPLPNPLTITASSTGMITGVVVALFVVVVVIVLAVLHSKGTITLPCGRICPAQATAPTVRYEVTSQRDTDATPPNGPASVKVESDPTDDPTPRPNGTEPRLLSIHPLEVNEVAPRLDTDATPPNGPESAKVESGPTDDPTPRPNGTEVEVSADVHPNTYQNIGPAHEDQTADGHGSGEATTSSDNYGNADDDEPDDGELAPDKKLREDEREDAES